MYELIRIMHDSLLPFFPVNVCDSESVGFQRIEPHDLFGFLLAFFRSLHVANDCADRIGTTRGRGRGGISLLLIRFHRTFVHDRAKIRLSVHGLRRAVVGAHMGMDESGVNHRQWKGGIKGRSPHRRPAGIEEGGIL